ncbi:sigma-70 family RNA polymerase sigma factor [Streptomyces hirsutus]|uniref:sigma-70 family RNA polymerase sigma factor n=1 Tax=Streptomyces hirsutus TaxID=35620 RepID=UPI0006E2F5BD|nr:sigma-70 family RNA polymerase sigma factor [Streptomyces hirsutus]
MRAQDELVAAHLPLVYNIVGRALNGHPEVEDVVQETMLRALGSLGSLKDPGSFRSWLVAITMNQIRRHWRSESHGGAAPVRSGLHDAYEVADPGADFVDLTILRLGLEGQRREAAEATRWLDPDDQALLSLWWLEAAGELTRAEVAAALELPPQHTAVRVQRMKAQLETARLVVRALSAQPRCVLLDDITEAWDGVPSALWRKRIARHARDCTVCAGFQSGLVPAEGLLVGLGLVPVAAGLLTALGAGTAEAAPTSFAGRAPAEPGDTATASYGDTPTEPYGDTPTEPYGDTGGPVPAGSPAENLGTVEVGRRRTNRSAGDRTRGRTNGPAGSRAQNRARRRRSRNIAAVAAALLVTGGAISGWALLTPDGEADKVRAASTGRPGPTASEPASPSPSPSASAAASASASSSPSPSPSPSASASPDASRKPKSSATPSSEATRTKPAAAPAQPEKTSARPEPAPSTAPAAAPGGTRAAQVLALTNTERAAAGCSPVTLDNRLNKAAQLHSEDMSANNYFSHTGQNGSSFVDRVTAQGHPSPGAENIARGQSSAESVMEAWMNSEGHRANILNCSLTTMGVGVVTSDWTWTQVFGR